MSGASNTRARVTNLGTTSPGNTEESLQQKLQQMEEMILLMKQQHEQQMQAMKDQVNAAVRSVPNGTPTPAALNSTPTPAAVIELEAVEGVEQKQNEAAKVMNMVRATIGTPASAITHPITSVQLPRLSAVEPKELKYTEANKPEVLDEWIFRANQMLIQQQLAPGPIENIITLVNNYFDLPMSRWWQGTIERLKKEGKHIQTWEQIQSLIRTNFLSAADEEKAVKEMRTLKMKPSESMDAYMQRVEAIYRRISGARMNSESATEFAAEGVDISRFPILTVMHKKAQKEHRQMNEGKGIDFNTARQQLTELAQTEPTEVIAAAKKETQSSSSSSSSSSNKFPKKAEGSKGSEQQLTKKLNAIINASPDQQLLNNLKNSLEGVNPEEASEMIEHVKALMGKAHQNKTTTSSSHCFNCRKSGHTTRECKEPFKCFKCGDSNHLARECTKKLLSLLRQS
jgi:hypothetical protein